MRRNSLTPKPESQSMWRYNPKVREQWSVESVDFLIETVAGVKQYRLPGTDVKIPPETVEQWIRNVREKTARLTRNRYFKP